MNEYYLNLKAHVAEFEEVIKLNEDLLNSNPYCSNMNLDNFPTHKLGDETYCAASKNWSKVDPQAQDVRSLHYASEDRVFLIFRNKYTQEWEFPTGTMKFGTTFMRAKQTLFDLYTDNLFKIKYQFNSPLHHTIRNLTEAEKENPQNNGMQGVRTYFFGAHHYRGFPTMSPQMADRTNHDDFAWIPKRQLNEYFTREYYTAFIHALRTR